MSDPVHSAPFDLWRGVGRGTGFSSSIVDLPPDAFSSSQTNAPSRDAEVQTQGFVCRQSLDATGSVPDSHVCGGVFVASQGSAMDCTGSVDELHEDILSLRRLD